MNQPAPVRVRFAPSPTGFLHVGGARTALFNWLYARNRGGTFVLRIEDTDQERSTEESYAAILSGMQWLGMDWDEGPGKGGDCGPYKQSERLDIYQKHLLNLAEGGHAYKCFCSAADLEARQEEIEADGGVWEGYDGACRHLSPEEIVANEGAGTPFAWRLKTPEEGATFWYDLVLDKLEFQNEVLVDRVIVKADGFPTYQFACVVDDHEMGMSHVLRGDDHVSNTPFQILIYEALGWKPPKFGHMPMILGPDKKRLSKRHGATSVEEFENSGVLPQSMFNYLALLGWSPGGNADEVMLPDVIVKKFSLKKINKSPAGFDYDKLAHITSEHIKRMSPQERLDLAKPILAKHGWDLDPTWKIHGADDADSYLARVLKTLGNRFSNLKTLPDQIGFFYTEEHFVDAEAWNEHVAPEGERAILVKLADAIEGKLDLDTAQPADAFEEVVRGLAEELDVKAGALIHPSRVALTGQTRSAGIFDVMELVGAKRTVARMRNAANS